MYKYIVYKTTNKINNYIYIGVHRTKDDIDDGYIGCGLYSYIKSVMTIMNLENCKHIKKRQNW